MINQTCVLVKTEKIQAKQALICQTGDICKGVRLGYLSLTVMNSGGSNTSGRLCCMAVQNADISKLKNVFFISPRLSLHRCSHLYSESA